MDSLESQINNHDIFSIDQENIDKENIELYISEKRKFLDILMKYLKNRKHFKNFGKEFFDAAKSSLKYYKKEHGKFLNYFETILKRNLKIKIAIENKQINKWKEKDPHNLEQKIVKYKECFNDDIEQIEDKKEKNAYSYKDLKKYLEIIEKEFQNCQKRQKLILRDLLTIHFIKKDISFERKYEFINANFLGLEPKDLPNEKDIGKKYGKSKESVSRTKNDFLEKIQKKLLYLQI